MATSEMLGMAVLMPLPEPSTFPYTAGILYRYSGSSTGEVPEILMMVPPGIGMVGVRSVNDCLTHVLSDTSCVESGNILGISRISLGKIFAQILFLRLVLKLSDRLFSRKPTSQSNYSVLPPFGNMIVTSGVFPFGNMIYTEVTLVI